MATGDSNDLILQLHSIGGVKFGTFILKTGIKSPIYFDLRVIISHPKLLVDVANQVYDKLKGLEYDNICGVPYTALPIASCVSTTHTIPMLLKRKETKDYGTKKILEGSYKNGDRCVIIEDVVTSGGSVLEVAACLKTEGLVVTDVIALLDRNQGGRANLEKNGIKLHSVISAETVVETLVAQNIITETTCTEVKKFIASNQVGNDSIIDPIEDIVLRLHDIGSFRFGSFKLSNGMITPIYVDLRLVISHPNLMGDICKQMYKLVEDAVEFDILCGVPYAALHLATCIAKDQQLNNVLLRKVVKAHGTGKLIEGVYKEGQKCLVVEDVMVSGQGIYEACQSLKSQGVEAVDALLVLDREQHGAKNLEKLGIKLHCLVRVSKALDILVEHKRINSEIAKEVMEFLRTNPASIPLTAKTDIDQRTSKINELLPFADRSKLCKNPVSKRIFSIMSKKSTNLCVSADVTTMSELLKLADEVGPHICILKTHVDILDDFTSEGIQQLVQLSTKHDFVIFEDRKFADIGSTVQKQYSGGIYKIADWADFTNAHSLPGPGIVDALKQVGAPKGRACVLLAEMSSKGNLANASYSFATVNMAKEHGDFVIGFISQSKLTSDPALIHMTPGVRLGDKTDGLGQQYITPEDAVTLRGADIIIVGRGITKASDVLSVTRQYQQAGFNAYENVRSQQKSDR